jgi:hypothetical protein
MPHPAVDPTAAALADPVPADHAAHDAVLVAAFAAGDAEGAELEAATALVTACAACTTLHHDLRAIAAALPLVPAPARTRDFRLTPGQAASLRPAGWRRLLAPFAGPRFAFAAPLGSGLAALGVVGILLAGTGLPLSGATAGVAPAEAGRTTSSGTERAPVLASDAPSPDTVMMAQGEPAISGAPDASVDPQLALGPADQPAPGAGPGDTAVPGDTGSTIPVALVASLMGLAAGLVLVLLRFAGRSAVRMP